MIANRVTGKCYEEKESRLVIWLYKHFLGRCLLKILTCKFVSNLGGMYMRSPLSKFKIKKFIRKNNINMDEYIPTKYHNFDAFFTRQIKPELRPMAGNTHILVAPSDAKLLAYKIDDNSKIYIKGRYYTLVDLLKDELLAKKYEGGICLVFRLCVDDYHHYAYIDDGKVLSSKKIKGRLHTVRPIAFSYYPVFKENKREYALLRTKHYGDIVQMEVGAMMVGRICNHPKDVFKRGDERGYFRFGGSTIVLLFEKDQVKLDQDILENSAKDIETEVKMFESIGRKMDDV